MLVRHSLSLMYLVLWSFSATAQGSPKVDTLNTDEGATNMLLNIKIPTGEMYLTSSELCGTSLSCLAASKKDAKHSYNSEIHSDGTIKRFIDLKYAPAQASSPNLKEAGANMRIAPENSTPSYRSEYKQDPSLDTELNLELGSGGAWLDLSAMSFKKVEINSLFSDVLISYNRPNLVAMDEMDIHVAKAKIILKNLEQARSKKINVKNEMGDTKLIIGDKGKPGSKIHMKTGVGDCMLVIDKDQPTKIVLSGGMFSKIEVDPSFKEHGENTYVNAAYHYNPARCTTVFCEVDLGNISLMAK